MSSDKEEVEQQTHKEDHKSEKKKKKSKKPTSSSSSSSLSSTGHAENSNGTHKEGETKKPFNIRDTLNEEQLALLNEFHEKIKDELINDDERKWCTDMCLCRYLRARDYDLSKSLPMLLETIKWRRSYLPQCVTAEDVQIEMNNKGKMYRNGFDKIGRPIVYMRPGLDNTGIPEKEVKVKYLVYLLERSIAAMDESKGIEKLVWLIDYKDNSNTGLGFVKIAKEIVDVLQNHYPERLGVAYLINAPWMFGAFWKLISPFLNEVTKEKLKILKSKDFGPILEAVDADSLEEDFGGNSKFKYNFEEHWKAQDLAYPPVPKPELTQEQKEAELHKKEEEKEGKETKKDKKKKEKKEKKKKEEKTKEETA